MTVSLDSTRLGNSDLDVSRICLGTMTFGEQVDTEASKAILDRAYELGITFLDVAEMYPVPPRSETCGDSERIVGQWLKERQLRNQIILATKVAGPSRGMPWIRASERLRPADIIASCEGSLTRLQTDVIDLYQIHWPERQVPMFGGVYFDATADQAASSIHEQLEAMAKLVAAGKIRYIGLSNETPYGVHEFIRVAATHGLPSVVSIQNPYSLINRTYENGLDETCHRLNVSLLAYSPLAFGLLTGKYDESGFIGPSAPTAARMSRYASMRAQRWGRSEAVAAAKEYNALAKQYGLTPTALALAYCYRKWCVASTIIGVTSRAQLEENVAAFATHIEPACLDAINAIRWRLRDPAQ